MIRTAWPHDLPALRALFAAANDGPYDLAAVAAEKCFEHGFSAAPTVRVVEEDGEIRGAAVTCDKWLRVLIVAREFRRRGLGSALLKDAEARGVSVIAAEPGNYFTPGVAVDDEAILCFFRHHGYIVTRWTWNLEASVAEARSRLAANGPDASVRRPTYEEADRVLDFVFEEFGRIWRFEASKAFEHDPPNVLITEENGQITGFAVHDVNNRGLGFFGPTGVARVLRGRGLGARLLLASLDDLGRLGYERVVIPWTDALEFYRKACGAVPAHRFAALSKGE